MTGETSVAHRTTPFAVLIADDGQPGAVVCYLSESYVEDIARVKLGTRLTLLGYYTGFHQDPGGV